MAVFHIGDRAIGRDERTFVIAEVGSNHNGSLDLAKQLIDIAATAGVDAVKFQTFRASELYVEDSGDVEYLDEDRNIYEIIEDMEMPYKWIPELYDYCRERDVYFMSTPFDERSAEELADYVPAWKVASYTISYHPFLRHLAESDKPIIMSTGAHDLNEIVESVGVLRDAGADDFALLQCVAAYPTPLEEINVRVVVTLREQFDVPTGLSDHTFNPVIAPTAAVALGGAIIEKHFTLDKGMDGPDHQFALEPDELKTMVKAIRETETALGTGNKSVVEIEEELHRIARRSIQATRDIRIGEKISNENIAVLRPGNQNRGLHPKFYQEIIGCEARKDISKGDGITWDNVTK